MASLVWALTASAVTGGGMLQLTLVGGRPCVRCTLVGPRQSIPAQIVIDLGQKQPFLLHHETAELLQLSGDGEIAIRSTDGLLKRIPVAVLDLGHLADFSKQHADALQQIPVVGVLGLSPFEQHQVQLDLASGRLTWQSAAADAMAMRSPVGVSPHSSDERREALTFSLPLEEHAHGYRLTGLVEPDFKLRVRFTTWYRDTLIDSLVADLAGAPGGNLDSVFLGGVDITEFVALRPEDLSTLPAPPPDIILGTDFLSSFRVIIPVDRGTIHLEQIAPPDRPNEEQAYYVARSEGNAEEIESFLRQNSDSHLAREAAEVLYDLRTAESPLDDKVMRRAIEWRVGQVPEHRRAMAAISLADEWLGADTDRYMQWPSLILDMAEQWALQDMNGTAAHHVQARRGFLALQQADPAQARRHLLSAAFGLPKDPTVNLWLGLCYERMNKFARAWSRYIEAALADAPPEGAWAGLDRLHRMPAFRQHFTMSDAEAMLEGRVPTLHASSRFAEDINEADAKPCQLVELFTCVDDPNSAAWELAFGALMEYLVDEPTVFVAYHLSQPFPDPLSCDVGTQRAHYYNVSRAPAIFFDGVRLEIEDERTLSAQQLLAAYQNACAVSPHSPQTSLIDLSATFQDDTITGQLKIRDPEAENELSAHLILCEHTLVVPGDSGLVLRRQVARYLVSPDTGFTPSPMGDRNPFPFGFSISQVVEALNRHIEALERERRIELLIRPTFVDPRALELIGFVQDRNTRRIVAACSFTLDEEMVTP